MDPFKVLNQHISLAFGQPLQSSWMERLTRAYHRLLPWLQAANREKKKTKKQKTNLRKRQLGNT